MMSPGTRQGEKVYADLKEAVLSGRYASDTELSIAVIAEDIGTSGSPVRDGLHRLYGEGLLQMGSHRGFKVLSWAADTLRDCYTWHGHLIRMAIKSTGPKALREPVAPEGWLTDYSSPHRIVATAERMFLTLANRSSSHELAAAVANTGERLRTIRLVETERWSDCADELVSANILARFEPGSRLLEVLWNYHRRRIRAASMLSSSLKLRI
ncbi:GntR family transcriptional regulator [Sphingobium ummariense]